MKVAATGSPGADADRGPGSWHGSPAPESSGAAGTAAGPDIFALATGLGRAAIAVLRLSGGGTGAILDALCGGRRPPPRRAGLRTLRDPADGAPLDRALVLWFPGPRSYTGEDAAELHLHAGPAVVEAVSAALVALGARPAEPGEFTRRAFNNGRLDLLEAEGVADLVEAETEAQRRQALRQAEGALSRLVSGWAERLRRALAFGEALIDFPDEDLPPDTEAALQRDLDALAGEMRRHLADADGARRVRDGLRVVILGAPNAGKSSLLNRLAGRNAAIVSPRPGTTRDALEVRLVIEGVPVCLVDTAGLRDAEDPVEAEGVRRAREQAGIADLVLLVAAPDAGPDAVMDAGGSAAAAAAVLPVWNKRDLARPPPDTDTDTDAPAGGLPWLAVSAATGDGIDALERVLAERVRGLTARGAAPPLTRARHRAALSEAAALLEEAGAASWPELRGESLRLAMRALGRLTGAVGVEDLLDTVFNSFCIGK